MFELKAWAKETPSLVQTLDRKISYIRQQIP